MNKQGPGKIGWCDLTWSPVHGCLGNPLTGCLDWCYGKTMDDRFKRSYLPTFYPERLDEPFNEKKPSKIFVCSVSDFFAPWFKLEWQQAIFKAMYKAPWHTYQMLTKWPENIWRPLMVTHLSYSHISKPCRAWFGTTVTCNTDSYRIKAIEKLMATVRFISFEPLLGPIDQEFNVDWIIIGAMTGKYRKKMQPKTEWIDDLVRKARQTDTPIFIKRNLQYKERIQELPRCGDTAQRK